MHIEWVESYFISYFMQNVLTIIGLVDIMSLLDFVAGSCGGAVGIFAGYPFDTVKVLIQNQTLPIKYTSTFQTIFKVINEDGFRRLYR